jgi:hypothetical protein
MSVEEVLEADRKYFLEHPDEEEFIREFCPGEFGAAELPEIPPASSLPPVSPDCGETVSRLGAIGI